MEEQIEKVELPRVFVIPESNYEAFTQKFERLQRRAAKLGCSIEFSTPAYEDRPGYYVGTMDGAQLTYIHPWQDPEATWPAFGGMKRWTPAGFSRRHYFVTVTGDRPKIAGWQFVGSVESVVDEEGKVVGNMLRLVPGQTVPVQYREAKIWCDHCAVSRRWRATFIIRHDDGTHKMVGRNCLKDFTGHQSPEAMASYAEILFNLSDMADCAEGDDWEMGGHSIQRYEVEQLLVRASAVIRKDGWKPAAFEMSSTKSTLTGWYCAKGSELQKWEKSYPVTDVDRATATSTLEWMISLAEKDSTSEYEHNLSIVGRSGVVEYRSFGLVASAIAAWNRAHDREMARRKEAAASDYVGTIGKREEFTLTLSRVSYIDGVYGTKSICKFLDEAGNVIMWFYSGSLEMENGTKVRAKATVDKHEIYQNPYQREADERGVKQTIVKRLKVVEVLHDPSAVEEVSQA